MWDINLNWLKPKNNWTPDDKKWIQEFHGLGDTQQGQPGTKELQDFNVLVSAIAQPHAMGDRSIIVAGHYDGCMRLWHRTNKTCIKTIDHHTKQITALKRLPKHTNWASASADKKICIWNVASVLQKQLDCPGKVVHLDTFTAQYTEFLVFATANKNIYLWDYNNKPSAQHILSNAEHFTCMADRKIAFIDITNNTIKIWDYTTQQVHPHNFDMTISPYKKTDITCMAALDNTHIALGTSTRNIYILNWQTQKMQKIDHNQAVVISQSPYSVVKLTAGLNNTLLAVYSDGCFCSWDWGKACIMRCWQPKSGANYCSAAITALHDGKFVAAINFDLQTSLMWDFNTVSW